MNMGKPDLRESATIKQIMKKEINDKIKSLEADRKRKEDEEGVIDQQIQALQTRKEILWLEHTTITNQLYFLRQGKYC
jgi:ribosome recycling factor